MAIALGYLQTGKINSFSINGEQTQMGQIITDASKLEQTQATS